MSYRTYPWILPFYLASACVNGESVERDSMSSEISGESGTSGNASTQDPDTSDASSWGSETGSVSTGALDESTDDEGPTESESGDGDGDTDDMTGAADDCASCAQAAVDPGGACELPLAECVADMAPDGCFTLLTCTSACPDEACADACFAAASESALAAYSAIGLCILDACPDCGVP